MPAEKTATDAAPPVQIAAEAYRKFPEGTRSSGTGVVSRPEGLHSQAEEGGDCISGVGVGTECTKEEGEAKGCRTEEAGAGRNGLPIHSGALPRGSCQVRP